jgi:hypothetical protein
MVKISNYRPGKAFRVPGGWGFQISRLLAHEGGKVVSPLPPTKYSWYSFLLEAVDPRAIVLPEGLCQWKIPMTSSGVEPTTLRLVVQCLNQLRHRVLPDKSSRVTEIGSLHSVKIVSVFYPQWLLNLHVSALQQQIWGLFKLNPSGACSG